MSCLDCLKSSMREKKRIYHPFQQGRSNTAHPKQAHRLKGIRFSFPTCQRETIGRVLSYWWLEFLSCALVIIAFVGIVTVLYTYQDQPLPNWPHGLSITTVLSVLGIIFKGPVLLIIEEGISQLKWQWLTRRRLLSDLSTYDQASRGPWGSTKMLWKIRWRHITGSLGALVTILALGVDPFTQAVISFHRCFIKDTMKTSSISRLNSFYVSNTQDGASNGRNLSTSLRIAIDNGFSDSTTVMPNFTCSTENCRFTQPYHSVAVCSRCSDISPLLESTCDSYIFSSKYAPECNYTMTSTTQSYNATAGYYYTSSDIVSHWRSLTISKHHATLTSNGDNDPETKGLQNRYESSTLDIVSFPPVLGCRCWLYLCIGTYTASIDSGMLKETLQSASSNWSSDWIAGTVRVDCLSSDIQSRLLLDGYISKETEWMAWEGTYINGTKIQQQSDSAIVIPTECYYVAPPWTEYFSDSINGSLTVELRGEDISNDISLDDDSSSILYELYGSGSISLDSITAAFENFTTVVSNYLRTLDGPPPDDAFKGSWNHPVAGEAFTQKTCIHVRWQLLTLPTGILVATIIFFGALIVQTAGEHGRGVWKSSQNALLWHGLDGLAENEASNMDSLKQMDRRAKELTVQLGRSKRGWKLIQHA